MSELKGWSILITVITIIVIVISTFMQPSNEEFIDCVADPNSEIYSYTSYINILSCDELESYIGRKDVVNETTVCTDNKGVLLSDTTYYSRKSINDIYNDKCR